MTIRRLLFFFSLFSSLSIYSQSSAKENPNHYISYDKFVGIENIGVANGIMLENEYRNIYNNYHQYFKSLDFLSGSVHYNGQVYYGLELKYNIYEDEVLVKFPNKFGEVTLKLLKERLDFFLIDGHKFLNVNSITSKNKKLSGFYEVLLENDLFVLHKKYDQSKKDVIENKKVFYHFLNKNSYIINYKDNYHTINSKSEVSQIFSDHKNDIKTFYYKNRALRKLKPDLFAKLLLEMVYAHASKTNNNSKE